MDVEESQMRFCALLTSNSGGGSAWQLRASCVAQRKRFEAIASHCAFVDKTVFSKVQSRAPTAACKGIDSNMWPGG